jgi:ATP-dependent DNA helicase RecG
MTKGAYKPYKVKTTNKFYIRAGSVSVEPTNEELIRLFQNGQQFHFANQLKTLIWTNVLTKERQAITIKVVCIRGFKRINVF